MSAESLHIIVPASVRRQDQR